MARLRALLTVKETPKVLAGSFASAMLCGTSPFFVGVPLLPLLIRFLRLNKVVSLTAFVLLIANPALMFLMVFQAWLGLVLLGEPTSFGILGTEVKKMWGVIVDMLVKLRESDFSGMAVLWHSVARLVAAYAIGGYGFAILAALLVFFILWPILEYRRARAGRRGAR